MSSDAKTGEYRSNQFEFTEEHGRTIAGLADAMRTVANLLQLLGLALVILAGLQGASGAYPAAIGLGAAALLFLAIGFWTGGASASFRKVVETKNEDIWHIMNGLRKLHGMYSLLRTLVIGTLVLSVVGLTLAIMSLVQK